MSFNQGIETNVNLGLGIKWRVFPRENLKAEDQNVDYNMKILDDNNDDVDIESRDSWKNMEECKHTAVSSEAHPEILNSEASQPEFTGGGLQHRPFPACTKFRKEREIRQKLWIQKSTKFHYFCCCLMVLSLLLGADSSLVEVPKNTVVAKGKSSEAIEMPCKSDCQCNLPWFVQKSGNSEREELYNGYFLRSDADFYCTVKADEPGKCYLNLTNTEEVAQTYICLEPTSSHEASAELIWLGASTCNDYSTKDLLNLICSIEFRGNWAPTMEWKEHSSYGEKVLLVGVNTTTVPNQLVTSTLVMGVQDGTRNYTCTVKFDISGKSRHTTATNIPEYTFPVVVRQQDKPERKEISYKLILSLIAPCFVLVGSILLISIMHQKGYSLKCKQPKQTCHVQDKDAVPLQKFNVNQKSTV